MESMVNEKCAVEYKPDRKEIFIRDLTDRFNEPAMYNKTVRGLPRAWEEIKSSWTPFFTMHNVSEILAKYKVRTHYWCMVD